MPKIPYKADKSSENDEDYEIVSFEDFCDKPAGSKTDLLTLNDNINYRLCYENDKTLKYENDGESSSRDPDKQTETSLTGKNVTFKRKLSGTFAPFGRYSGKTDRGPLFSGVIPKPRTDVDSNREHRYQRFSENRNVFRRLWDNFPGLGSTALAVALVIALAVGVWWVVCGALGTSWGDHHYKKLWERAHPDNIKKPLSPIPFEKPPVTEYTNSNRYHDHNNLSTKNKNVSAEVPKKKEALKKNYNTIPLEKMDQVCGNVSVKMRFDCSPGAGQDVCEKRGCCWRPTKVRGAPFCYYPPQYNTFRFLNMTENKHGMRVYYERWRPSGYPDDWTYAAVDFKYLSEDMLRIKIYDPENKRFEVPVPQVPIVSGPIWNMKFKVVVNSSGVGFKVVRLLDTVPIINMQDVGAWILSDKMLQVSFKIPTHHVFGIGEHRVRFERDMNWKTYTLFNRDIVPMDNMNLYGSHPFHMAVEISGKTSGMLLHNSNAMDVVFQPTPAMTYRTTGGVLDFFVFVGPTPKEVISQLTTIIGRPFMPPYWSLGMHLCKYGYKDLNYTRAVWKRNREAGIPFDVQWNDIDYMKNSNDFTINPERFSDLPKFVEEVHNAGMHYVMLFDPGVSAAEKPGTYPPFDRGLDMDVFVKNRTNQPFIAKVWNPVSTAYPDFTHPNATPYWLEMMSDFHRRVQYDGAWIDMNEPSNFLNGEKDVGCEPENLPYRPIFIPPDTGLKTKTLCMEAKHYIGPHYDVHNLYALYESMVTNFALQEIRGKRPFIISRASYPGLGHYAGHWTGDIQSTWEEMRMTIPAILSFSLFGIPMVGADICGFGGRTTPELCKRWMQLGAFYPFSRNHADNHQPDHDPAAFTPDVVEAAKKAYRIRYTLLPYYYTLFWRAHVDGETVVRPLFFEYYGYDRLYPIDDQFLIGKHVMITPILKENATTTRAFFPGPHKFYNFVDGRFLASDDYYNVSDDEIVSVKSGAVIPLQQPAMSGPVTTTNCRSRPLQLIATPVQIQWHNNIAKGELYWDDGDSLNSYEEKKYSHIEFTLKDNELQSYVKWWGYGVPSVNNITIFGLKPIESVTLNNRNVDFIYKYHTQVLTVENLNLSLDKPFKLTWHYPVTEDNKDEDDEKYNKPHSKTVDCVNNEKPCTIND